MSATSIIVSNKSVGFTYDFGATPTSGTVGGKLCIRLQGGSQMINCSLQILTPLTAASPTTAAFSITYGITNYLIMAPMTITGYMDGTGPLGTFIPLGNILIATAGTNNINIVVANATISTGVVKFICENIISPVQ